MAIWSFERIADLFLHSSEKGGTSPYLLRKRVFAYANIIQLLVTVFALAIVPLSSADGYPADRLILIGINGVLSVLFLASARLDINFERPAFFYVVAFLLNVNVAVYTSGGGLSYLLSWYVVIAVAIGFFLHGWKRNVALLLLGSSVSLLIVMEVYGFKFPDSTTESIRPLLALSSLVFSVFFCGLLGSINSSLFAKHERVLANQANTDPLTGLLNRRGFLLHVDEKKTGSLLMIDIDHFKLINDDYGHDAGDRVLINLAEKVQEVVRDNDRVVRLGGEEFAIWFNRASPAKLSRVIEKIRVAVAQPIQIEDNNKNLHTVSVRVSGGLVERPAGEGLDCVLAEADRLLYKAKTTGRDQILSD